MIKKVEHLGIAVSDMKKSEQLFKKLLGRPAYKEERVETEKVITKFFKLGETKIELLQSVDPEGVIAKFIGKKGEGMHHIALEVDDIKQEMKRLAEAGFILLSDEPYSGADNKLICFLHPKTTNGMLIELCQERG